MKKWILACGIIVIAIMGLQLTAQDVSSAEHIDNQVVFGNNTDNDENSSNAKTS